MHLLFENSNWRKQLDGGALIEPQNAPPIIAGITSLAISK